MKKLLYILGIAMASVSCTDMWDSHYNDKTDDENVSDLTLDEYFKTESQYQQFYNLLKGAGVDAELGKDQFLTVWAVKDANYDLSVTGNMAPDLVAKYHVNYLAFGPSDLKNGLRIQSLSGIYMGIAKSDAGSFVNSVRIVSSKRFKNGVVHEIGSVLVPRTNMFDFVRLLDDGYSIIRDSILKYNSEVFDKANSIPIGVDATGNTLYDSVFYTSNPLFAKVDFSSEFQQFTMFLPSNTVINDCFTALKTQYDLMGKTLTITDSILAISWIKEAIFHNGLVDDYHAKVDLSSPFSRVWRTTVQQVNLSSRKELSNGVVYEVEKLKIPNNVIISRIKSLVHYYEYLTDEQKTSFYNLKGCTNVRITKGDQTPITGFYYWVFEVSGNPETTDEFSAEFLPLDYKAADDTCVVMKVPPGEYNLYMGFRSSGHPYVDVFFQSGEEPIADDATPVMSEINASASSPWNYDRVNETDPKISKWNGLGGLVGVVNVAGDGMSTFRIKVKFNKLQAVGAAKKMQMYHWSLKPTANNY